MAIDGAPSQNDAAGESAVVVVVDDPALRAVHADLFPALAALGMPPHVTLFYPFVAPDELDAALPSLGAAIVRQEPFAFSLTDVRTFPRTVWLAPDDAAPLTRLTTAIHAAFPDHPPYGGRFDEAIPHVTLVDGIGEEKLSATLALARSRVASLLPLRVVVAEVVVLAEREDGRWVTAATLPLRGKEGA